MRRHPPGHLATVCQRVHCEPRRSMICQSQNCGFRGWLAAGVHHATPAASHPRNPSRVGSRVTLHRPHLARGQAAYLANKKFRLACTFKLDIQHDASNHAVCLQLPRAPLAINFLMYSASHGNRKPCRPGERTKRDIFFTAQSKPLHRLQPILNHKR